MVSLHRKRLRVHLPGVAALLVTGAVMGAPVAALENARTLILAIDSIPLPVVEDYVESIAGSHSVLANLSGPTALVSTFPSISNAAWTGILAPFEVAKPLGYHGKYYDRDEALLIGFTSEWLTPNPPVAQAPWQYFFNWRIDGALEKAIAYGRPAHASTREVRQALSAFDRSKRDQFFAYIISTDGLGHASGPEHLLEFLGSLDRVLLERADERGHLPFRLVLLSDHGISGGEALTNLWPVVEEALAHEGFRVRNTIEGNEDVAIVRVGMISAFEVNTTDEKKHDVAALLSRVPGIDLCVSRSGKAVRVFGSQGTGIIRRKHGELGDVLFSYEWRQVDPLDLEAVMARLGTPDGHASPPWFSDSRWFEATQLADYPDPLYRLYHSFEAARHPASLLCSLEAGYAFGATGLEWLSWLAHGEMKWTHGALTKADSVGFIMTNEPNWRPRRAVRFNEALRFLREPADSLTLGQGG